MADLVAEMFAAAKAMEKPHFDRLRALGVLTPALAKLCESVPALGVVEAQAGASGLYDHGGGVLHVVTPVIDGGEVVDLCAWRPSDPTRWWMRTGSGWALDFGSLDRFGGWSCTLDLFATPLDWLAAGGEGVCVLDWSAPEVRNLAEWPAIRCSDGALARALRETLSRPVSLPKIELMEVAHAA